MSIFPPRTFALRSLGAIDVIVHLARLRDGRRVVWEIASVEDPVSDQPVVEPLFRFRPRSADQGCHEATGFVPRIAALLAERGEALDGLFEQGQDR